MFYNMLRCSVDKYTFTDRERSAVFALRENDWPVITKFPSDCFYRKEITEIDPGVRWMAVIRDPRAVLCSKHKTTGDIYKVSWDRTFFGKPMKRFRKGPGKYRSHWGLMAWDDAIGKLPSPFVVKYEELVRFPATVQTKLMHRFGFEYHGYFGGFHKSDIPERLSYQLNGIRPVEETRVESWKEHPERMKEQFAECPALHDVVMKWGYEKDTSWIRNL